MSFDCVQASRIQDDGSVAGVVLADSVGCWHAGTDTESRSAVLRAGKFSMTTLLVVTYGGGRKRGFARFWGDGLFG